ncbi:DMT family transporter [Actinoplanes sp. NPDC051851]|uniref:DMT family transporter n=1 Tax=Actinoplanes sp. NPDC051851 TaxID=3154753 RepID=UPI003429ED27
MASLIRLGLLGSIWGSVFLWIKVTGYAFAPIQMVFARLALGAVVLLVIAYAKKLRPPRGAALWGHLTVAALLGNALPWTLFAWGERTASSSVAGVVNATTPMWTVLVTLLWRQERRLGGWRALGLALGLAGTLLIAAPWHTRNGSGGILAFTIGTISLGASFAYMARFLTGRGLPPLVLAAGQLTAGTLLMLPALAFGGRQPITVRADALAALLILGVICTGLAYVLNVDLILREGGPVAATVTYLFPPVAVLLGALFLDEPLTWPISVGSLTVLTAIFCVRRQPRSLPTLSHPSPAATPR